MKRLSILLAGVSLLAPSAWAGSVSNVAGTLDATLVDPTSALYPHFICASGCSGGGGGGSGAVTQSGPWSVGISNFPAVQNVGGSVSVPGVATAANQPVLSIDGGSLAHVTNLPAIQPVSGSVSVSNLPASQPVTGTVSVGNFPAIQAVTGSISVSDWPATQPISGMVSVGNFPSTQTVTGALTIGGSVGFGAAGTPSLSVQTIQGITNGTPLAMSLSDGGDVALGATSDATWVSGSGSAIALLKAIAFGSQLALPPQNETGRDIGAVEQFGRWSITPDSATPTAGAASTVTTGGTAVNALSVAAAHGCQVINPLTATDEGIGAVEPLFVNIVTTAATSANGTTMALGPGQSFQCVPGQTTATSINAATSGHKATVFAW